MPRLHELMTEAAKVAAPIPNATILEEDDRAASAQLYWMMLMICKRAALNIVFLAGDSKGLEAWRQLTEKYEPKMRTRFAGELMSILSFSLQRDTTERIRAWEREIATCERDSGNVLDDEIKIGTFLLGLPASQTKTLLLMSVDTLKKWTDLRGEVVAISRAISTAQTQPTPMDIGAMNKGTPIKHNKQVQGAEIRIPFQRSALTSTWRAESAEKSVTWRCAENGHMSSQCPKKQVRAVDDVTVASQVGSQDTTMVGAIGSFSDFDSVSEGIPEPKGGGAKIFSVGVPSVCEVML